MGYEYIDFGDESIPLGKRKVAYVKWKMRNGMDNHTARILANRLFGPSDDSQRVTGRRIEQDLVILVVDRGNRMQQRSFGGTQEIYDATPVTTSRYKDVYIDYSFVDGCESSALKYAQEHSTNNTKYVVCTLDA